MNDMDDANMIQIPVRFLTDSEERGFDVPLLVKRVRDHVWLIRRNDPHLAGLISDAQFYTDQFGPDGAPQISRAAKALLKALARQGVTLPNLG